MLADIIRISIGVYIGFGFGLGNFCMITLSKNLFMIFPLMIVSIILSPITPIAIGIMLLLKKIFGYHTWYHRILDIHDNIVAENERMKAMIDDDIVVAKKLLKECEEEIKRFDRITFWIKTARRICIGILVFLIFRLLLRK